MHSQQAASGPWNGYKSDWHESWNGWKHPVWHDQSYESSSYSYNRDAYASWQTDGHNTQNSRMMSHGNNEFMQMPSAGYSATSQPSANQNCEQKQKKAMPSFDALRAFQGDDASDNSDTDAGPNDSRFPSDQESTSASGGEVTGRASSSDEGESTSNSKEATREEVQEAEEVLRLAFHNVKERNTMRAKVSTASSADLQAMLNARLKKGH